MTRQKLVLIKTTNKNIWYECSKMASLKMLFWSQKLKFPLIYKTANGKCHLAEYFWICALFTLCTPARFAASLLWLGWGARHLCWQTENYANDWPSIVNNILWRFFARHASDDKNELNWFSGNKLPFRLNHHWWFAKLVLEIIMFSLFIGQRYNCQHFSRPACTRP